MNDSNLTPWDFPNINQAPLSADNIYKIIYHDLDEIAMGAPLGGQCFLETADEKIFIYKWCGGPSIWESGGLLAAIPIWTRKLLKGTVQQIGIIDTKEMVLKIFSKTFRVLDLHSFDKKTIHGYDSPIYNRTSITFDIEAEKIETEINLIR
ncbi:MAG: hypothetical protein ACTHMI_23005 [Mucilaginibacter sp.]